MIDVQIPDSRPEVNVEAGLRAKLAVFHFDTDKYVEGLQLAGVPDAAIDTLAVDFTDISSYSRPYSSYTHKTHTVAVSTPTDSLTQPNSEVMVKSGVWEDQSSQLEGQINYSLANTASWMAANVLRDQDIVEINRTSTTRGGRILGLGAAAFAGSVAGGQVAEATGAPVLLGTTVGGLAGAAAEVSAILGWEALPRQRQKQKARGELHTKLAKRAEVFAERQDAFEIFSQIVQIEFVK